MAFGRNALSPGQHGAGDELEEAVGALRLITEPRERPQKPEQIGAVQIGEPGPIPERAPAAACPPRHGVSRLPEVEGDKPRRSKLKRYPLGYFHISIAEVHTEEGRLYRLVAIDRTSKFAFVELFETARDGLKRP